MSDFKDNDLGENPTLKEEVTKDTTLKEWLVNYVGAKKNPGGDKVTVEMVLDVVATEFPEFVLPLAEENFIRGYHQALTDVEEGQKIHAAVTTNPSGHSKGAQKATVKAKKVSRKKKTAKKRN